MPKKKLKTKQDFIDHLNSVPDDAEITAQLGDVDHRISVDAEDDPLNFLLDKLIEEQTEEDSQDA